MRSRGDPGPLETVESPVAAAAPFTPIGPRYKMVVNKDGVYRLSASWAATNAPALVNANTGKIRIDCQGRQMPITVIDANSNGIFDGTDSAAGLSVSVTLTLVVSGFASFRTDWEKLAGPSSAPCVNSRNPFQSEGPETTVLFTLIVERWRLLA